MRDSGTALFRIGILDSRRCGSFLRMDVIAKERQGPLKRNQRRLTRRRNGATNKSS